MKNIWIWAVVIVVIIGGGYWYWQSQQVPAMSDDGTPAAVDAVDDSGTGVPAQTQEQGPAVAPMTATVTYDGSNFSPSSVAISKGGTVTFTSTAGNMWVASAPHPAHTGYDGTSRDVHCAAGYTGAAPFDQCKAGTSFTFTFTKSGTWGYHNHMNANATGQVVVQ